MGNTKITVYARTDENGTITDINSSVFLYDTEGWTAVDEGEGDRYAHAQSNYLAAGLIDEIGLYNYKLVDGKPELRSDEDKAPERELLAAVLEIDELKHKLAATDYISVKIGEGAATPDEYADRLAEREAWRARINELESKT